MCSKKRTRPGAAIAVVMAIIVILTLSGMSLLAMAQNDRLRAISEMHVIECKSAADAGLGQAVYLVERQAAGTWNDVPAATDVALPGTNCTYSYTVSGTPSSGLTISSTGKCGPVQRTVQCTMGNVVELYGMVADGTIYFKNNLDIYGEGAVLRTNLATTDAIQINKGTIDADLVAGPGAVVADAIDTPDPVSPHGKSAAATKVSLPAVTVPAALTALTPISSTTTVFYASSTPTSYKVNGIGAFTVKAPNNVTLYVNGNLDIGNQSDITVEKGAKLTVYVDGNVTGKNGVGLQSNDNSDPTAVAESIKILGTSKCTSITAKNNGSVYGLIYAPSADFEYKNNTKVYGALMVKTITSKNNAEFHYVKELVNYASGVPSTTVAVTRWWE